MRRSQDWLQQARKDLVHAKESAKIGHYEWCCYASQQSAEKSLKALYLELSADAWGHSLTRLLKSLPKFIKVPQPLLDGSKTLDRHYIPARYPNGFDSGAPEDYFTNNDALEAISIAENFVGFCTNQISAIKEKANSGIE